MIEHVLGYELVFDQQTNYGSCKEPVCPGPQTNQGIAEGITTVAAR